MSSIANFLDNYIYFYHLDEYFVIPVYPDSIADSMSSSFTQTNALARSAPVFTYNNSGPRTVQISLSLHRDMMDQVNFDNVILKQDVAELLQDNDYVDMLINRLQAAALPRYRSDIKSVQPPVVAIRFGDEVFIKGVVNGTINVSYTKPILTNNKYAQVNISFVVSEIDPYDADTVAQQGSFRGITRTFKQGIGIS